jgi:L-ribulose-5-phosphate 3-epimerase UlaE
VLFEQGAPRRRIVRLARGAADVDVVAPAGELEPVETHPRREGRELGERIYHVHMKDVWWGHGDGTAGVFGGHTTFADPRRYWDFRSLGHGDIKFEDIIVALNDVNYQGPLSVEWEDSRMDREHGAAEAAAFVKRIDFKRSAIAFDAQFDR